MSIALEGMGRGDQGQLVLQGMGREPTGPPVQVPPLPYGGDLTDRILRDDVLQWARMQERVEAR